MNFRECRMVSLHELINHACDGEVDESKLFLMLGGIRNAIYYFKLENMQVIATGGAGEINCPSIFKSLHIEYDVLPPDKYVNLLETKKLEPEKYYYVIPVIPEILNKSANEIESIQTLGQSFFVVDSIKDRKIYFKFNHEVTYLDVDILRMFSEDEKWLIDSKFGIYTIDKFKLKNNDYVKEMAQVSKEQLVYNVVESFFESSKIEGDSGSIRIDGPDVYDLILNHFAGMKTFLHGIEDDRKSKGFIKYIYIQSLHFRKFILSGTDAYYRNEFDYILRELYGQNSSFKENLHRWDELVSAWRNFGRMLSKTCTYKYILEYPDEYLDGIIEFWKNIKKQELDIMGETRILLKEVQVVETEKRRESHD